MKAALPDFVGILKFHFLERRGSSFGRYVFVSPSFFFFRAVLISDDPKMTGTRFGRRLFFRRGRMGRVRLMIVWVVQLSHRFQGRGRTSPDAALPFRAVIDGTQLTTCLPPLVQVDDVVVVVETVEIAHVSPPDLSDPRRQNQPPKTVKTTVKRDFGIAKINLAQIRQFSHGTFFLRSIKRANEEAWP